MKLSTRVRYGVRAMMELARQVDRKPVPLRKLAENQAISSKYLEQIATALKIAGLIESVRGAVGGYRLARPAEEITVWDIYVVLDVAVDMVECTHESDAEGKVCQREGGCAAQEFWTGLNRLVRSYLKGQTLRELADREEQLNPRR